MMDRGKRAVIYTRVSRDDSGEGKSNDRQREDCVKLAELRGWEIVGVEEDVSISAYSGKTRPAWNRVVEAMQARSVDVVIAWHMDRITRTVRELTDIVALSRECGVGIATVNGDIDLSNDTGKMVATILGAVAEAEVERKGARQRRANQQRASEGKRWQSGWRAFGYLMDGTVVESEAEMIRDAAARVLDGGSLNGIAREWNEAGVTTPRNAASGWTHNGVKAVLANPKSAGLAVYRGEVIGRGDWDAILSEETHTLLLALLSDPERLTRRGGSRGRRAENLLSGIARCATCGETVVAGTGGSGAIYQCKSYHVSTPREEADAIVRASFAATVALSRPGAFMPMATLETTPLLAEAERLRERLASLSASYVADRITIEQMEAASASLRDGLAKVEQQLADAVASPSASPYVLRSQSVRDFLAMDLDGQRATLAALATITLYPRGRGKRNVPIKHQVSMTLRDGERVVRAVDDRPKEIHS